MEGLMSEGVSLMLLGTVFVFLSVLVLAVTLMSKLIVAWSKSVTVPQQNGVPKNHVAAIVAAIELHERDR
jgi:Na+-transporting methylmalonyl-CoA/oxaloacetate decarboxylase gamma subunit